LRAVECEERVAESNLDIEARQRRIERSGLARNPESERKRIAHRNGLVIFDEADLYGTRRGARRKQHGEQHSGQGELLHRGLQFCCCSALWPPPGSADFP